MMKLFWKQRNERMKRMNELARQRREVGDNGWTCHVCGDYRPDAQISIYSKMSMIGPGIPFQQNVRYCNDRPDCIAGAPNIDFGLGREKADA